MGYLLGMIWLFVGVVFVGVVQDFMVLFVFMCCDGCLLGELVKEEMGLIVGVIVLVVCFMIMVIIFVVLVMIVVKVLIYSLWGIYIVVFIILLVLFMGIYLCYLCLGCIGEVLVIGLVFLIFVIIFGGWVVESLIWVLYFDFIGVQLIWMLVGYGFVVVVLLVWLLLVLCDYFFIFLKIGIIVGLVVGILIMCLMLIMFVLIKFVDGIGLVWIGNLFLFLFIIIVCGVVFGFYVLIFFGIMLKMLVNEGQVCFIGYGGMLMEFFVVIMVLVFVCIIDLGVYFVMNSLMVVLVLVGMVDVVVFVVQVVSSWGFSIILDMLNQIVSEVGEQLIIFCVGGVLMLVVGMVYILYGVLGGMMDVVFWYYFVILFEVLFILMVVDVGMCVVCFMLQDLLGVVFFGLKWIDLLFVNLLVIVLCVLVWGYFFYQGVVDLLGGINILWLLFGIVNQMLVGMVLMFCVVVLFKMKC